KTPVSQTYYLQFENNGRFSFVRFNFQGDYGDKDSISGKWQRIKNKIHFFDIDQPKYITVSNTNGLGRQEIKVSEDCVRTYESHEKQDLLVITLDKEFKTLEIIETKEYVYDQKAETLETKFRLHQDSHYVIYI